MHRRVDVQALDCDFYAFTGHKLYGPTGIGVLWAGANCSSAMPPFMGGGDMISSVTWERTTWAHVPHKFEAGTPAILEAIGLKAAIGYVSRSATRRSRAHEASLTDHALARLSRDRGRACPRSRAGSRRRCVLRPRRARTRMMSATLLDRQGIAVRAGHHCAEPLMRRFGVDSTARASFGVYTTHEEIDALADTLMRVREFF